MPLCRQNDSKLTRAAARILRRFRRCMSCRSHTARAKPCGLPAEPALPVRSVTNKGKRLVLPRLDVPATFLAALLCFSAAALPAAAQEPPSACRHRSPIAPPPTRSPAAQAAPAVPADPAAPAATPCASQQAPPRAVAHRRAEVSRRLYALRLGQSRCAEGRHPARLCRRLVRQPQPVHGEGRPGRRSRPHLRFTAGGEPRRAVVRVRPHRRVGLLSAGLFVGDLRHQPQGAFPRRLADHARGRHLLVR